MSNRRGFMSMDGLAALIVLSAVAVALMTSIGQRYRSASRLADTRDAARLAETALLDLQQGKPANPNVVVRKLDGGDASLQWTQVSATVNGRQVTLTGAVRRQP